MRALLTILLITSVSIVQARYGYTSKQISLFYGPSYRSDRTLIHSFDLDYSKIRRSCTSRSFRVAGARLDFLDANNFAIGLKYQGPMARRRWNLPLIGIVPTVFQSDNTYGFNVKPEVGYRFSTDPSFGVGATIYVAYGYEIPIIGEDQYFAGRHDISIKVGLSFSSIYIGRRRRLREEPSDEGK